jgi:HEPN domain-containing protein
MKEKINEIISWIKKADHDLGTAIVTYLHIPEFKDTVTFHCQQSVEKCLKAYLIFLDTEFKYSHDLIYLLELISMEDTTFDKYFDNIIKLQNYSVEIRYPNETMFLSKEQVIEAIETSKLIRNIVCDKMNLKIDYNEILDQEISII